VLSYVAPTLRHVAPCCNGAAAVRREARALCRCKVASCAVAVRLARSRCAHCVTAAAEPTAGRCLPPSRKARKPSARERMHALDRSHVLTDAHARARTRARRPAACAQALRPPLTLRLGALRIDAAASFEAHYPTMHGILSGTACSVRCPTRHRPACDAPQPMVRLDEVQNKFILKAMEEANVRHPGHRPDCPRGSAAVDWRAVARSSAMSFLSVTRHATADDRGGREGSDCSSRYRVQHYKPATRSVQHAVCNTERATRSVQHAVCNMQRAARSVQHATRSTQHAS